MQPTEHKKKIRTLVLSGGGGRGAFHAGVYKYLMMQNKPGIDNAHRDSWQPDVIVGTSIGAVNGAAIAQGMSPKELEEFWLGLRVEDVQGLPPGMSGLTRFIVNRILGPQLGTRLRRVPKDKATSVDAAESWPPLPLLPRPLSSRLIGRWNNLLDTGPLRETLSRRLNEGKIAASDTTLLISATSVRTGEAVVFSNKSVINPDTGLTYAYCRPQITIDRIIASCSIPIIYPWTRVGIADPAQGGDVSEDVYWDGAVVANTPLGPAFDAVNDRPLDEDMEAVVVMMTPWWETSEDAPDGGKLPDDFGEAITWTLDWALLASFRRDLKLARAFNKIADMNLEMGYGQKYRRVKDVIVAPTEFMDVTRILDYDEKNADLIQLGFDAAEGAFKKHFGVST